MTIAILVLSILSALLIIATLFTICCKITIFQEYLVTSQRKWDNVLENAMNHEIMFADDVHEIKSQLLQTNSQTSTLLAQVDSLASKTAAALRGVDKNTLNLLKGLMEAIENQDAVRLSQVIRSAKTMIENDTTISEEIENARSSSKRKSSYRKRCDD